jgi:hypothetical protein
MPSELRRSNNVHSEVKRSFHCTWAGFLGDLSSDDFYYAIVGVRAEMFRYSTPNQLVENASTNTATEYQHVMGTTFS